VGFVPTLGALHDGHLSLIKQARSEADLVVVSIFLNPTQFGLGEDLNNYPKQEQQDVEICRKAGVDAVFLPSAEQIYPEGHRTVVKVEGLSEKMCGADRPVHFAGVCTVVAKLFNIVQPDLAYFGQKDAQQALIIKRMVQDLDMPTRIQVCPTVREEDGLAMSSRNAYLTERQRNQAVCLYQALQEGRGLICGGERDPAKVIKAMKGVITRAGPSEIDYVVAVDPQNLEPATQESPAWLLAVAVRIGGARLIDNILVDIPGTE
jgi:pantoate--beta-alanine ligase